MAPEGERSGFRVALGNVQLRSLLCAFAALNFSEWSFVTALSIEAYRVAGTLAVGFVGFRFVPGALSSALLAPLAENHRRALSRIAACRVLLLGVAAAAILAGVALPVTLVIVVLDAAVAAAYRPTQSHLLARLARTPAEVTAAAAGISTVKTVAQGGGALAGGLAVEFVSPGTAMAAAAGVMVIAALLSHGLDRPIAASRSGLQALRAGIAAIPGVLRHREASPLVFASGLRTFVRGLWTALLVVVALQAFRLGSSGVGIFNGAAGLGAVAAVGITASLIGRSRLAIPCAISFVLAGVTLSVVGGIHLSAIAVAVICVWGAAMAIADATSLSLLHRLLDAPTVSRTVGVMESLKLGAEGLGALLAPALVALFGVRPALILAGLPLPVTILLSSGRLRRADREAAGRSQVVTLLHGVPLLQSLDMAALEDVAARTRRVVAPAGAVVIRQGDRGDAFYVIGSGSAEVLIDGYRIGRLHRGSGFGERALLYDAPRIATVRAETELVFRELDRTAFLSAITGMPADAIESSSDLGALIPDRAARPLAETLAGLALFADVERRAIEELADQAELVDWQPGATVVRQGEPASELYVVVSGRARAAVDGRDVSELMPGDSFGEIGILHQIGRTATVTAIEALTTYQVPGSAIRALAAEPADAAGVRRPGGS